MNIRLIGTKEEIALAVKILKASKGMHVLSVSRHYANRGNSEWYRVYVKVEMVSTDS